LIHIVLFMTTARRQPMRSCTLCWDMLVLQEIYVLRMPENVTMSPYWNWTRSWVAMMTSSSSTTAAGERAVLVAVLMTYYSRPAVSVPNTHLCYYYDRTTVIRCTGSTVANRSPCFGGQRDILLLLCSAASCADRILVR